MTLIDDIKKRVEAADDVFGLPYEELCAHAPSDLRYLLGIAEAAQKFDKLHTDGHSLTENEWNRAVVDAWREMRAAIEGPL